jgi:lambda family phage tail tape measure protein
MAGNTVNFTLNLTDEGSIDVVQAKVSKLNKDLTITERLGKTASAAFKASGENQAYGQARGTMGGTGAGARDFANEAQGLGGLVRLYATVAANIFAASAAFNALKDAMATTNMIEGLNQLGAQSGQSLGTLAKNFADASGGAISLRDAMQATVQATSAGLSTKQFSQLGDVAKKASLALGRDMADSVSRLTRGITKLEPELLDELGIFTKVGKATEDYARSVGKSVDSLTDFEKRQAFANAVLKEGADKFGSIDIPANPYDKLLASLKNLAQTGLEVVNNVLGPLIGALSQSPAALTTGIAALSVMLLKQALPAIGQYRQGLVAAAETAKKAAEIRAGEAGKAVEASASAREAALDKAAEAELRTVKAAAQKIEEVRTSGFGKQSKAAEILKKNTQDVTQAELDYLTKVGERYKKQGKDDIADRYFNAVTAIKSSAKAEAEYQTVVDATTKKLTTQQGAWTALGQAQAQAKRTADIATSKSITSNAAENTAILGMSGAWSEMRKQVGESQMGPIRKAFTTVSSAISIASTALMGFVGALQTYIFIIGAVIAGARLLDSYLTKNAEQSEAFKLALDNSNESVKNYDRTLKALSKMDSSAVFSAAGVTAQANAFKELSDNLGTLREKFEELDKATTGWDRFWDGIFSKSQGQKFAEASVSNITKLIAGIDNPDVRAQMTAKVDEVLGTTGGSQLQWLEALKKGGPEAAAAVKQIEDKIKPLATGMSITASRSKEFDDQLKKLTDSYKEFAFSAIDKSPMSKLGDDMLLFSTKTVGALADTEAGLGSMNKLLQDATKLGMFSPDVFAQMQKMRTEVEGLNKQHGDTAIKLKIARQEVSSLELEYERLNKAYGGLSEDQIQSLRNEGADTSGIDQMQAAQEKLNSKLAYISELNRKDTEERRKIAELMASPVFKEMAVESFKIGADLISKSIDFAFQKASIDLKRGILGNLSDLPGSGALQREVDKQDIGIQRSQLEMQAKMLQAQYLMIAAQNQTTAAVMMDKAKARLEGRDATGAYRGERSDAGNASVSNAQGMMDITAQFNEFVTKGGKGAPAMVNSLTKAMKDFGKESPEMAASLQQMLAATKSFMEVDATRAGIDTKDKLSKMQMGLKLIQEQKTVNEAINSEEKSAIALKQAQLNIIGQQNAFQTEEQVAAQKLLSIEAANQEYAQQGISIAADRAKYELLIAEAKKAGLKTSELEDSSKKLLLIRETNREADKTVKTAQAEAAERLNLIKVLAEEEMRRLNIRQIIADTNAIRATTTNELNDLELQYQINSEKFSAQQIADSKAIIETTKIQTEARAKLATLEINYLREITKLVEAYQKAAPGAAGEAVRADIRAQMEAIGEKYTAEVTGVNAVAAAKQKLVDLDKSLSERQKAYGDVFKKTFEGMADAIVTFVQTGKLDFKGLIDSMLADLLRYELRLQALAMYQAMRPGLLNFFNFGSSPGGAPIVDSTASSLLPTLAAKGRAYDYGIEKFAMGGTFTNQIVDSPTLFKFAQGTGMMGEAGPEAIMPLKRDANGNLGVRSGQQQPNVDVVINNYSTAQATTEETTDSKGNRRIEVTIGDMTAGEMSRSGSATQRSMRNTYGIQPQLIRR